MQQSTDDQPPAHEPQQHPDHHKPTESELKSARTFVRYFLILAVLSLLCSGLPLPLKVLAPALGLAAVVVGIMALVKAVRVRFPRILRAALVVALGISFVVTIGTAALVAVWPITSEYETCMSEALTQRAEAQCEQDYQDTLQDLSGNLTE